MKKVLTRYYAILITGCAQQTFTVKTNRQRRLAPRKPSPIISSFLELGGKLSMQPNLWRRRNVVKTETQQTFVNGLLSFNSTSIYTPLEACVCSQ